MKHKIKKLLQTTLGLERYLFLFSIFKIFTLRWDRHEGHFIHFLPLIPDEGHILDIGANIGIMSVLLARQAPTRIVHAFEPMPVNYRTLQKVLAWFGLSNVVTYPIALGNQEQEVEMVMPVVDKVRLQGISHVITDGAKTETGDRVNVLCKRLDDMTKFFEPGTKIAAIKMDVEGFEYFVFDGARQLLSQHRPVMYCEFTANEHQQSCIDLLYSLRYDIKVLEDGRLNAYNPALHPQGNFFLIPQP